jgi:23S rRNA pseudouridine2605 synthase
VADFFKDISARLFPVGRLDRDTTGLLIMTNDGELAFRLTHPRFGIEKRYRAIVQGLVTEDKVKRLEKGVLLEEGKTAPCKIKIERASSRETELFVVLHEGKKRQIRRIFESIGHRVIDLERLNYGPLTLGDLRFGQKRELTYEEVRQLRQATGLEKARPKRPEARESGQKRIDAGKRSSK